MNFLPCIQLHCSILFPGESRIALYNEPLLSPCRCIMNLQSLVPLVENASSSYASMHFHLCNMRLSQENCRMVLTANKQNLYFVEEDLSHLLFVHFRSLSTVLKLR